MDVPAPRNSGVRWPIHLAALLLVVLFLSLACWQVARRSWKLDLIARVEARVHAPPVPAPPPAAWPAVTAAADEYRHVRLQGRWEPGLVTLVAGASVLGSGYWQLVPLRTAQGWHVLVNRGFVAAVADGTQRLPAPDAEATVNGLLRMDEPGGRFLRRNDPAAGRWYSRDVPAIARARGLAWVAPYFIDADAPDGQAVAADAAEGEGMPAAVGNGAPVAGLTVVRFPNNHLAYALTWLALALLVAVGWRIWRREERRADGAYLVKPPGPAATAGSATSITQRR